MNNKKLLNPGEDVGEPFATTQLKQTEGPYIATSDFTTALQEQIRPYVPGQYIALGADGFFSIGVTESELIDAVVAAAEGAGGERESGDTAVLDFDAREAALATTSASRRARSTCWPSSPAG